MVSMEKISQNAYGDRMTKSQNLLTIFSAAVIPYRLDFRMNVSHSLASRSSTVNVCVVIESSCGLKGYGDCVPRSYVTGETPKSVIKSLHNLLPVFTKETFSSPEQILNSLVTIRSSETGMENPAAVCALELAVLDLAGKHWNVPFSELLGFTVTDKPLYYSLVVPLMQGEALEHFLEHAAQFNFKYAKIKVDACNPAERIRRIKKLLGDGVEIRVDANCSWSRSEAAGFMREMAELGVVSVEQPLPANDLEGTARLRAAGMPLIILDEAVWTGTDVDRIADIGACDVINVRVSKCGGILGALQVVRAAQNCGLEIQLGAHVGESCILSAAGAHLAACIPGFRWLEGCFGTHLLESDLCEETFRFGYEGRFDPPVGPGLGVTVSESKLDRARVFCEETVET